MKEQVYNMINTKDSRTQRQSNLNKFKEARFKLSPQEFEDHTLGEIVSLKYVFEHGSSESAGNLASGEIAEEAAMVDLVVCRGDDGDKDGVGVMGMVSDGVRLGDGAGIAAVVGVVTRWWLSWGDDDVVDVAVVVTAYGGDGVDVGVGWEVA
ncbi:hypothetical protein Tco_1117140 [Tanacetum coccineum]